MPLYHFVCTAEDCQWAGDEVVAMEARLLFTCPACGESCRILPAAPRLLRKRDTLGKGKEKT